MKNFVIKELSWKKDQEIYVTIANPVKRKPEVYSSLAIVERVKALKQ